MALLLDRSDLSRKIISFGPPGEGHGQLMQSAQRCSGLMQPACDVAVGVSRVVRQRHAANSRVKYNRVLRDVSQRPQAIHTPAMLGQPVGHVPRHAKGALAAFTDIKFREYAPTLRRVHGVVAQHMPLTGSILDWRNCVVPGSMPISCCSS